MPLKHNYTSLEQITHDRSWLWLRINKCLYSGYLKAEDVPTDLFFRFGDFHEYTNGDGDTEFRKTLGLHKATSEYITKSMFGELPEIAIDTAKGDMILDILKDNDFLENEIDMTETWIALGARIKMLYKENGKTVIDYIEADEFQPTQWRGKNITGGVLITIRTEIIDGVAWHYTLLQWHEWGKDVPLEIAEDGEVLTSKDGYFIKTEVYKSRTSENLGTSCFKELQNIFGFKVQEIQAKYNFEMPIFQYTRVPRKNNKILRSPMGLGWFTNALDVAKSCDESFDSLSTEIDLGRKKVAVSAMNAAIEGVDKAGESVKRFNRKKRAYLLEFDNDDPKTIIQDISGELRTDKITLALNTQLDMWDFKSGLSTGTTRFDGKSIVTATQVSTESSESAKTIILLENALIKDWKQFIIKLVHFHNITNTEDLGEITEDDITITFHDNIIIDENLEKEVFRLEIEAGIRTEWEYRMTFLNETDDEAKAFIDEINKFDDEFIESEENNEESSNGESNNQTNGTERENVEAIILNGAQITSAVQIIESFNKGELSRNGALEMLMTFLNIPREKAIIMLDEENKKKLEADKATENNNAKKDNPLPHPKKDDK